ncbi:hypothetical protein [Falsiruegeria litorea]|uniref:hypothetical protein n=1 Tax=Falsiruegeria litorea TaxID=1280831 RepID=UPI001BFD974C|nr:hypothetical protein [Falsiruegeria litorea]MBT8169663.1 hypothetical protein [Falsiruegeria litorea]
MTEQPNNPPVAPLLAIAHHNAAGALQAAHGSCMTDFEVLAHPAYPAFLQAATALIINKPRPQTAPGDLHEAVQDGTRQAIWDIATNATGAPCADFYDALQRGVEEAVTNITGDPAK